jgi:hypothetical protein
MANPRLLPDEQSLGIEGFKQQKLEGLDGQVGQHHSGRMRLEMAQTKAERTIHEELRRLDWQEPEFASRRKRDPGKAHIAMRLRKETTLSVKQIAARLRVRASAHTTAGAGYGAEFLAWVTRRKTRASSPTLTAQFPRDRSLPRGVRPVRRVPER